jgi:tetratricopeptide (TPR) repeat protein
LLASVDRLPEAIAAVLEATKIEPLDVNAWILLGWFYYAAGQFSPAHRALSHALDLNPQSTLAILILAQIELAAGKTTEAQEINGRQQIEQWRWCILVIIEHRLGHAHESERILNELIEKYGQSSPNLIAIAYAWRGEMDLTFEWLERAYRQRDPPLGLIQFHIGILSGLSSDPRYKVLLRKMNFPD